jgi:hypothetical protein
MAVLLWPSSTDYAEAIGNPERCFADGDLRKGRPLPEQGMALCHRGRCADVYRIDRPDLQQSWAVKCYGREVSALRDHYRVLTDILQQMDLPFLVDCQYLHQGIQVQGQWYPVLKMPWIEGTPLNRFVQDNLDNSRLLNRLASQWLRLSRQLRGAGLIHGDLEHGNLLVIPQKEGDAELRLVDYDGLSVPSLTDHPFEETRHPNYQHPLSLREGGSVPGTDWFSQLVIYTALRALAWGGKSLWERFDNGDNLLFTAQDFADPLASPLLQHLGQSPEPALQDLAGHLILASQGSLDSVRPLDDLVPDSADIDPLGGGVDGRSELPRQARKATELAPQPIEEDTLVEGHSTSGADRGEGIDFNLEVDSPVAASLPQAIVVEGGPVKPGEFDLVFDAEPEPAPSGVTPPPLPTGQPQPPSSESVTQPGELNYFLEAWMQEQMAVIKLSAFVNEVKGQIVQSIPGLVRVHLWRPARISRQKKSGLWSWLGLDRPEPEYEELTVMELHLKRKDPIQPNLLHIRVCMVAPNAPAQADGHWRRYCDQMFCNLRGYLIGTQ